MFSFVLFGRFVSCLAFVWDSDNADGLLVSGSGDSTVSNHKNYSHKLLLASLFPLVCVGVLDSWMDL